MVVMVRGWWGSQGMIANGGLFMSQHCGCEKIAHEPELAAYAMQWNKNHPKLNYSAREE